MYIIITLVVAVLGGFIAARFKIPAGPLIGALIAVSIFNIMTANAIMPVEIKLFTQVISGIFIGSRIEREDIKELLRIIRPAILTISILFMACISMGIIMHYITGYSLTTTLFATAPGGIVHTTLMSDDMNADTAVVSVLQVTRLVTVISLFPFLLKRIINKFILKKEKDKLELEYLEEDAGTKYINKTELNSIITVENIHVTNLFQTLKNIGYTVFFGAIFGLIGYITRIPAGVLMFAMIGCAFQNIVWKTAYIPKPTKNIAQVFAGALIGTSVTLTAVVEMRNLIVPALLMMVGYFIINMLLAIILYKKCKVDLITALFSCTPGGASTISLMAGDFGAKVTSVSTLQILRSVCVVTFYPFIIQFVYSLTT
ncbi:AbrB family transcriptional regulator [Haloplasma contractile]|uniref:Ammonia monooxygenase protein n=1 Tax=Haloplasma contractile SSD-17B TaxID=1033810 RepID=U2FK03_9MOLU|nr:AbrB family transcriptional regulator [Haloplasma contractile]ERJ13145.1 ammonia monooxygenase protein [Haloplasma contractile SSD-17B]